MSSKPSIPVVLFVTLKNSSRLIFDNYNMTAAAKNRSSSSDCRGLGGGDTAATRGTELSPTSKLIIFTESKIVDRLPFCRRPGPANSYGMAHKNQIHVWVSSNSSENHTVSWCLAQIS